VIGRPLMRYRMHPANISSAKRAQQYAIMREVSERNVRREAPDAAPVDIAALLDPLYAQRPARPEDVAAAARLVATLLDRFAERHQLTVRERRIAAGLGARWLSLALLHRGCGWRCPGVLARFPLILPTFGLPLLGEAARAVAARLPWHPAAAVEHGGKRPAVAG
jgi:hypothetical protein